MTSKTIIYVDMDHVLCDYAEGYKLHKAKHPYLDFPQSQEGLYVGLEPMPNAIETFKWLQEQPNFEVYILSAPSIKNPHSYSEKREWVEKHLGFETVPYLILSCNKGLNRGDYLIDDYVEGKGQENFQGKLLQFGSKHYPDWTSIKKYFKENY